MSGSVMLRGHAKCTLASCHTAQVDLDLKVDLSRDTAMLFRVCPNCNASMLKDVLNNHERFCHGAALRQVRVQYRPYARGAFRVGEGARDRVVTTARCCSNRLLAKEGPVG